MSLTPLDEERLREALQLAEGTIGITDPNPRVGCVIGHADGRVIGRGATQRAGQAHAEIMALADAKAAGHEVRGATAWVTLEPCAHHGRTPPCCDALIDAGLERVVVAIEDPFPRVAGQGIARLRAAGITVDMATAETAQVVRDLNIGFFSRVTRGRPWVRAKIAASLDGRTALPNGASQWITGPEARAEGHAWRRRAGAVVTGIGTVLADDPRLDVRLVPTEVQPIRVVVDSRLRTPPSACVLAQPGRVLIACSELAAARASLLRQLGADVVVFPGERGSVDLVELLAYLASAGINELHLEAGSVLTGAFLRASLIDELLVYLAPKVLGEGKSMATVGPFEHLTEGLDFQFIDAQMVGRDMRLRARRLGVGEFDTRASLQTNAQA